MTVKELKDQLNLFNPNALVVVRGYEGGYDNASKVKLVYAIDKGESEYDGRYEEPSLIDEKYRFSPALPLVYIEEALDE